MPPTAATAGNMRCPSSLRLLLVAFLAFLCLLVLPPVAAQYVILDCSDCHSLSPSPLPQRLVGLSASFGAPFPTNDWQVDLSALPADNAEGCAPFSLPARLPGSRPLLLLVRRGGNCTFAEKALHAQEARADGIVVVTSVDRPMVPMAANDTESLSLRLPSCMVDFDLGSRLIDASLYASQSLEEMTPKAASVHTAQPSRITGAWVHRYERRALDPTFALMLLLALATLMLGAYLAAFEERRARAARVGGGEQQPRAETVAGEETLPAQYLTTSHALGFIFMASLMLVVLFFFIRYLIYLLLLLFALGGAQSVSHLCTTFLRWRWPSYTRTVHIPRVGDMSVYSLISMVVGYTLSVTWLLMRHHPSAWVLQDILGVGLLLVLQQSLRLPDIKVSSLLLSLAFVYDVFWVFLSGYFFRSSVMVTVAQGGDSGEVVPMLLRMPRLQDELGGDSMLGLGDIALPGLFVAYLLRFDLTHAEADRRGWTRGYFLLASVGYAVGLALTYLALLLSEHGQPALLYLVPCTLGLVIPLAWWRGDLGEMWRGSEGATTSGRDRSTLLSPRASSSGAGSYEAIDAPSSRVQAAEEELSTLQLAGPDGLVDSAPASDDEKEMMDRL